MNLLIADDEESMVKIISAYLIKEGFNVFTAKNGEEAIKVCEENKIDLAILDWMMPIVSGLEACKYIKENTSIKVLILTAKSENEDEINALSIGADEYVKKPFDPRILIIRIKKLLNAKEESITGDLRVNTKEQKVYKNNELLQITKIEYSLLKVLIENKGIILSRDKLIEFVWGLDYEGDYRTVDTHIRRLRAKIGEEKIKTYRGIGYSLEE